MDAFKDLKAKGDAACSEGKFDQAVYHYSSALWQPGNDVCAVAAVHSNRCHCYLKLGSISEAIQDARAALTLCPRWPKAHLRLAQSYELGADLELSIAVYRRALELDPSLADHVSQDIKTLRAKMSASLCSTVMQQPSSTAVYHASVEPKDREVVAAACADATVRLWDHTTGSLLQTLVGHSDAVTTVAWSEDGETLASGSLDTTARLWLRTGPRTFKSGAVLQGHTGRVSAVVFGRTAEIDVVITASNDHTVRIWEFAGDRCLHTLSGHSALVADIALSPDSSFLASASGDAVFKLWRVASGGCEQEVAWDSGPVVLCGFLPGKKKGGAPMLLTAHAQLMRQEARVLLWDVLEKKEGWVDGRLAAPAWAIDGLVGRPTAWDACNDPEGAVLLAVACGDGGVRVWDISAAPVTALFDFHLEEATGGAPLSQLPAWRAASLQHTSNVHNLVKFSEDGALLAASGPGNVITVRSVEDGSEVCALAGHVATIRSMHWVGQRSLLSASVDGTLRRWHILPQ